jgi:hypothetical protein
MTWIAKLFSRIEGFFASKQGQKDIATINTLVTVAVPIVEAVAAATGNLGAGASIAMVNAAYQKYGVLLEQSLATGSSTVIGNALLNLTTTLVQKNLPKNLGVPATSLIQTAVQIAVVAQKANL